MDIDGSRGERVIFVRDYVPLSGHFTVRPFIYSLHIIWYRSLDLTELVEVLTIADSSSFLSYKTILVDY